MKARDPLTGLGARERIRHATILTVMVAIIPIGILFVAMTSTSWWNGVLVVVGLFVPLLLLREWVPEGFPKSSVLVLAVSAGSWAISAVLSGSPLGVFALSLSGAMVLTRLPRHRVFAVIGFCLAASAIGALAFIRLPFTVDTAVSYLLIPAAATLLICIVLAMVERYSVILLAVERAKQAEAELAVARERIRFAGDLHDIQGHTLHVIKLKTALARQITESDPAAAARELDEVQRLISGTIDRTRDLVYARRRLNLPSELENAKNLLDAAGFSVTIETRAPVAESASGLLAQVLRETTTNILRHANGTAATITIDRHRIMIVNDGADAAALPALGGLATLRARLEDAGGGLELRREAGLFHTVATMPGQDGAPPARSAEGDA